ncbi:FemAB family PEP-CTERM system-associated protein [Qipengyuania sp. YG27]|uniref:FemAB family PEP-CTERM system-associated protein n=1 Tax=Qipengyuania mesophila TaxID=2867246 RepID=A0ABS7JQB5_9SPHN|nr:FemAB family XrtA/PEP-CTERM system-associated protein [Qipengyuania mesophila]MBX7499830.1 FemAB family PEP-CTERM system-associated protein [Qipengyuania mesophila]
MTDASGPALLVRQADLSDARERARIEAFVAEHGATPFHRPAWLLAIEQGTGQRGLGLVAERAGAIAGWLPLTEVRSALFSPALVSSGFGVGGGVLSESDEAGAMLCRAAQEMAQRLSVSSVELRGGTAGEGWEPITGKHANFSRPLAADHEAELEAIPRKARAEVRKCLRSPLEIVVGHSNHLDTFYRCYAASVHNLGTPVFPRKLFAAVLDHFGEDADILTALHEGRAVSSVLSLYHNGAVMPYWGGGGAEARALKSNERVYFELMDHGRARGCTHYDYGRSKVGSGPYNFKKWQGFEPEPLTYWSWTAPGGTARNIDPTDQSYSASIDLWKKLPLSVATRIGPFIARGLG